VICSCCCRVNDLSWSTGLETRDLSRHEPFGSGHGLDHLSIVVSVELPVRINPFLLLPKRVPTPPRSWMAAPPAKEGIPPRTCCGWLSELHMTYATSASLRWRGIPCLHPTMVGQHQLLLTGLDLVVLSASPSVFKLPNLDSRLCPFLSHMHWYSCNCSCDCRIQPAFYVASRRPEIASELALATS